MKRQKSQKVMSLGWKPIYLETNEVSALEPSLAPTPLHGPPLSNHRHYGDGIKVNLICV